MLAAPAVAQSTAGTIAGRVTLEAGGDPVHGASIVVVGARRTAVSSEDGKFEIANVPPGSYEVLAQREHFTAARQTVTVVAGQTVTVNFTLSITGVHEEVTVTGMASGTATAFESFSSVTSLDSVELAKNRGATITEALANEPGIAVRSFGVGNARPIIRGFDGDRVLIMQDGVRTGDLSSQSGDHGVSIDPGGARAARGRQRPCDAALRQQRDWRRRQRHHATGRVSDVAVPGRARRSQSRHRERQRTGGRQRQRAVWTGCVDRLGGWRCAAHR